MAKKEETKSTEVKEEKWKRLLFISHNPRSLNDIYWDPDDNIVYHYYNGILRAAYKLTKFTKGE